MKGWRQGSGAIAHDGVLLLDAPITFAAADGPTHSPLVRGQLNGVATCFILDTGATDHILTTDLCEAAGLPTEPGEPGTDSSGSSVPSWWAHQVVVGLGQVDVPLDDVVVISTPPPFRRGGIGGALSPQHVHPDAHVLLDLATGRFAIFAAASEGLEDWLADAYRGWRQVRLSPVDGDGTLLVEASIDPFPPTVTMLDTGAKATYAAQKAVPGLGVGRVPRRTGHSVGGTETFAIDAPQQVLRIGGATLPVDLLIAGHEMGVAGCVVGMDLLRNTVLVFGGPPGSSVRLLLR